MFVCFSFFSVEVSHCICPLITFFLGEETSWAFLPRADSPSLPPTTATLTRRQPVSCGGDRGEGDIRGRDGQDDYKLAPFSETSPTASGLRRQPALSQPVADVVPSGRAGDAGLSGGDSGPFDVGPDPRGQAESRPSWSSCTPYSPTARSSGGGGGG